MADSKHTRASGCGTNPFFLELFRNKSEADERERIWHSAISLAGGGTPPLRFPVYETLYLLNVYAQKMIDLLEELSSKYALDRDSVVYHQSLIQYVRASASQTMAGYMSGVEITEGWLFESQRLAEERRRREQGDGDLAEKVQSME
jgi:hypothetical protein